MEFRKFNEIAELVGIVAIVTSLIFVGLQVRQSQLIALAELEGEIASASIEMASLISDNSEVWHRGITNEELDASEATLFKGIVVTLSDRAISIQSQFRLLGDDASADSIVHDFAAFLYHRPGARRAWIEHEADLNKYRSVLDLWTIEYATPYVEMIKADLSTLDRMDE